MRKQRGMKGITSTTLVVIVIAIVVVVALAILLTRGGGNNLAQNNSGGNNATENKVAEEFVQVLEDGTKLNTSSKLAGTKTVDGLEVSNFQLTENGGQTVLLAKVKNSGAMAKGGFPASVIILDKDGNELVKLVSYIPEVAPGEEDQLNVSSTLDYANAYDIKIEKV